MFSEARVRVADPQAMKSPAPWSLVGCRITSAPRNISTRQASGYMISPQGIMPMLPISVRATGNAPSTP